LGGNGEGVDGTEGTVEPVAAALSPENGLWSPIICKKPCLGPVSSAADGLAKIELAGGWLLIDNPSALGFVRFAGGTINGLTGVGRGKVPGTAG
jgi:hypothetical protein